MTESEEEKIKPSFREGVRGVWRHLRPHKRYLVILMVLGLISAVANGLVPYVTGRFLDALIAVEAGESAMLFSFPFWMVVLTAWALIQIVANVVDWVTDRMERSLNLKLRFGIETNSFSHLLRLPISYHTDAQMGGEISKINTAGWRMTAIVRTFIQLAPQILSVVIGVLLAISINGTLASILALGVLVYVIMLIPMLIPIAAADEAGYKAWNDAWNDVTESVHQVTSVKQAAAEGYENLKMRNAFYGKVYGLWIKLEYTWSNMNFAQRAVVFLTQLTVFIFSVGFVANGAITIGELVALNGYAAMFFGPFVSLGHSWQTIQNGLTSAAVLERMFALAEEEYHPAGARVAERGKGEVVFDNVSFEYEKGNTGVLQAMNFITLPGQSVALVGESGAGKSTTLALLSGYFFPSAGAVRVDDIDTREWDLVELRKRIAIVPQEVALFNDSIRANIRYGSFEATDAQVEDAARQAHIHEYIATLPKGFDTLVGERGVKLSVGQKQRVAIARAILRDPEILILDEPTSALDSQTEHLITESLERLMRGRTTFIIAHRLSTVRKADKILVMEKGRIVEEGSHAELMEIPDGNYRRLYELQIGLHD